VVALAFSAFAFLSRRIRTYGPPRESTQNALKALPSKQRSYVRRGALWPQLRWNLKALGDRLERPGKEQMVISGTLTRAGVTSPVVLNIESSNRMMLTQQSGLQTQVITFDGTQSSWMALSVPDRVLVETLLFDTAENFFFDQMKGTATRCLGFRFRPDVQNTTGPFHDIYIVTPTVSFSSSQGSKSFHFNSDTRLLDLVTYQTTARVEVKLSNWQETSGQKIARRIERVENGSNTMTLTIDSVVFAPAATSVTGAM
jgi:hypothetical protein